MTYDVRKRCIPEDDHMSDNLWQAYLARHETEGRAAQVAAIRQFLLAYPSLEHDINADLTQEGNILLYWDSKVTQQPQKWHMHIEFHPDGMFEWFWMNRKTGKYGGSNGEVTDNMPAELLYIIEDLREKT